MKLYTVEKLPPVKTVSPSSASVLDQCELRFGLESQRPRITERIGSPFAALGTISHRCVEVSTQAANRPLESYAAKSRAREIWDEMVAAQISRLESIPYNRHILNPEDWPGYFLHRARTIKRVVRILMSGGSVGSRLVEPRLESTNFPIVGSPDRVDFKSDGPVVIDWKSSLPTEGPVPGAYQAQLELYAVLVEEAYGEFPVGGKLCTFNGLEVPVQLDRDNAFARADAATKSLARYNAHVESLAPEQMATPNTEACQHCPFRGHCTPYWVEHPALDCLDFEGIISGIESGRSNWILVCGLPDSSTRECVNLSPEQFWYVDTFNLGAHIRGVNFYEAPGSRRLWPNSQSYFVVIDTPDS